MRLWQELDIHTHTQALCKTAVSSPSVEWHFDRQEDGQLNTKDAESAITNVLLKRLGCGECVTPLMAACFHPGVLPDTHGWSWHCLFQLTLNFQSFSLMLSVSLSFIFKVLSYFSVSLKRQTFGWQLELWYWPKRDSGVWETGRDSESEKKEREKDSIT